MKPGDQLALAETIKSVLHAADVPNKERQFYIIGLSAFMADRTGNELHAYDKFFGINRAMREKYLRATGAAANEQGRR